MGLDDTSSCPFIWHISWSIKITELKTSEVYEDVVKAPIYLNRKHCSETLIYYFYLSFYFKEKANVYDIL